MLAPGTHFLGLRFGTFYESGDVTRTTHTNLDVMQEKRINDYWRSNFVRYVDRIYEFKESENPL